MERGALRLARNRSGELDRRASRTNRRGWCARALAGRQHARRGPVPSAAWLGRRDPSCARARRESIRESSAISPPSSIRCEDSGRTCAARSYPCRRSPCARAASSGPGCIRSSTSCARSAGRPRAGSPASRPRSASAPASATCKSRYNRVFGYFIEVTQEHLAAVPGRLHPQPDPGQRRALSSRRSSRSSKSKVLGAEERDAARCEMRSVRGAARAVAARPSARPHAPTALARASMCSSRSRDVAAERDYVQAAIVDDGDASRSATAAIRWSRHEPGRALRAQRHAPRRRRDQLAADHRPQHGRQVDLHAPGGADRAAGADRLLRARRARRASASSTASSPASAPATTWPAASRPSWSR